MAFTRKKNKLAERDGQKCFYCGIKQSIKELTFDHVIPKSKGGTDDITNLVLACSPCNNLKRSKSVKYFLKILENLKINTQ